MSLIRKNPILRITANVFIPVILLYALYVQFHGEYGAGGGFQAGIIFTAGLILYTLIYGVERVESWLSLRHAECIASIGLLGYISVGIFGLVFGGNFLEYSVFSDQQHAGQKIGIFLIELSVGVTIVGVVMLIFSLIARQIGKN